MAFCWPIRPKALYDAGLRRINISLDALNPVKFKEITRRDGYEKVIESIHIAKQVGFNPVKINAVSVRGLTEDQIVPFGHFARETGVELRFIEFMPLDADNAWEREKVLFAHEILEKLSREIMPLVPIPDANPHAPATEFVFEDGLGRIGFIASVSQPFCMSCDRFRLTADGKLRNCLFSLDETDIKPMLRDGCDDEQIAAAIRRFDRREEGRPRNQHRPFHPAGPADVLHRRVDRWIDDRRVPGSAGFFADSVRISTRDPRQRRHQLSTRPRPAFRSRTRATPWIVTIAKCRRRRRSRRLRASCRSASNCRSLSQVRGRTASASKAPDRVIFTFNGTDCLNLAIHGVVNEGDHVITTYDRTQFCAETAPRMRTPKTHCGHATLHRTTRDSSTQPPTCACPASQRRNSSA